MRTRYGNVRLDVSFLDVLPHGEIYRFAMLFDFFAESTRLAISQTCINPYEVRVVIDNKSTPKLNPPNSIYYVNTTKPPLDKSPLRPSPLLDFWNELPNVRQHKNPNTKVYQQALRRIHQLRQGKMCRNSFDQDWLQTHSIPKRYLNRKWTDEEIRKGFENLSLMMTDGYWPQDKSWIPKNLPELIFNPRQNNSWFLSVMITEPEKIITKTAKSENNHPRIVDKLLYLYFPNTSGRQFLFLCKAVNTLVEYYDEITERDAVQRAIHPFLPTAKTFVLDFVKWCSDEFGNLTVYVLRRGTYAFDRYVEQLQRSIGLNLETGRRIA